MMNTNISLGMLIWAKMESAGLKPEDLAAKIGVSSKTIRNWANDVVCPKLTCIIKLAEIFNISISDMYFIK